MAPARKITASSDEMALHLAVGELTADVRTLKSSVDKLTTIVERLTKHEQRTLFLPAAESVLPLALRVVFKAGYGIVCALIGGLSARYFPQ